MSNLPCAKWFSDFFTLNKITRYIATLKASDGGYIKLAQPIYIGANDDFEITYVFATDAPAYSVLIGNGTTRLFRIEPNGELRAYCGVLNLTSTIIVNDGKLHTATVKRIGNVFSLKVDNENELSVANALVFSELIFNEINKHGASYSNVTPLELKSTTLNTLTHHYDFNVAKGTTIIPNLAQPLGVELYSNNPFAVANDGTVTKLTSDSWSVQTSYGGTNNLAYGARINSFPVTPNESYLFKVEANEDVNLLAYDSTYQLISRGVNEVLFATTETFVRLYVSPRTTNVVIFKNTSIKEAPNWAEYINVADDNKELYEWDAEHNAWVGNDTGNVLEVAQ